MSNQNQNRTHTAQIHRLDHAAAPWRRPDAQRDKAQRQNERPVARDSVLSRKELQELVADMLG
jgi:hypothetical protein